MSGPAHAKRARGSSNTFYFAGTKKEYANVHQYYNALKSAQSKGKKGYWRRVTVVKHEDTVVLECKTCHQELAARNPSESLGSHFTDEGGKFVCKQVVRQQQSRQESLAAVGHSSGMQPTQICLLLSSVLVSCRER